MVPVIVLRRVHGWQGRLMNGMSDRKYEGMKGHNGSGSGDISSTVKRNSWDLRHIIPGRIESACYID